MRILLTAIIVLFVSACAGKSERDAASDAYDRGDYERGVAMLRPLAEAGDGWAQFMLGKAFAAGNGVNRDVAKADSWFAKAVKSGPYKHWEIGEIYAEGKGVPIDLARGIRWYRDGVRVGDGYSLHSLGVLYLDGKGVPVDYGKAFDYFTRALAAGTLVSHDALAEMYSRGLGRPANWGRAVNHWKAAASAGSLGADWELADYFSDPDLGGQDLGQAEHHYLRSARSGSFIGLHKLGTFYRKRAGKPREALKWWSHAIRKGLFNMAYEIGRLYHDGLLQAEDAEATALAWYIVAFEQGTDHAKPKVAVLRNRLGPNRARKAARQAAAIRAELGLRPPPRAAP